MIRKKSSRTARSMGFCTKYITVVSHYIFSKSDYGLLQSTSLYKSRQTDRQRETARDKQGPQSINKEASLFYKTCTSSRIAATGCLKSFTSLLIRPCPLKSFRTNTRTLPSKRTMPQKPSIGNPSQITLPLCLGAG